MWQYYELFAFLGIFFFLLTIVFALLKNTKVNKFASISAWAGLLFVSIFIVILWVSLERPPLRTLGETRLWYSFFIMLMGCAIHARYRYDWLLAYCAFLASLFLLLNYVHPEVQSKALMPALQSIWFVPHVIVYMISYALLAQSALSGVRGMYQMQKGNSSEDTIQIADRVVAIGFGFLTMGLIFGALWAKEAWGHYWTWDPKETWALMTWLVYLIYIHIRKRNPDKLNLHYALLFFGFLILIICWFGIKYLPNAATSVHIYS
jgi:ABC-type transport system involved in cytochrome c biogenesis permease subunit